MTRALRYRGTTVILSGLVVVLVFATSACGRHWPTATGGGSAKAVALPAELTRAAQDRATADNGGKKIGGSLNVVGIVSGPEGAILAAALKPFEDATGIRVNYQGSHDANTIVSTRLSAGTPPDVYYAGTSGGLKTYLKGGHLVPLNTFMDVDALRNEFSPQLINSMTVEGNLYGLFAETDSYVLWHNPKSYTGPSSFGAWEDLAAWSKRQAETGTAPWCMAFSQGAGTGAAATYFIESIMLAQHGPRVVDRFTRGELPFTSPEVKQAFSEFSKIASDDRMVDGGPYQALSTPTAQIGAGMFTRQPSCQLTQYGEFGQNVFMSNSPRKLAPGVDIASLPFPPGHSGGSQLMNGHVAYLMKDTPQGRAFMRYYASAEFQSLLAAGGEWTVANKKVAPSALPNQPMRDIQAHMDHATSAVLGSLTQMDPVLLSAYYRACVNVIADPSSLDAILQGIEEIRAGNE
ncbi:ABC transporter substrate-binding protein [Nocardia miyunensis]|uniref:ABC transporter substrate-binding protein n=1 Tax=Nocardia miyunensis TaxID=282684 RepID=UPI0008376C6E|nr:ABC transporter substrate-binding protein [Nocardia miyunensis]